jgi:hypothetical protein
VRLVVLVLVIAASSGCVIVPPTALTPTVIDVDDTDIVPPRRTTFGVEADEPAGMPRALTTG